MKKGYARPSLALERLFSRMVNCYLGIGSNLGDRRRYINSAIKKLKDLKNTRIIKASRLYETEAFGGPPGQRKFLNAVLKIKTAIPPPELLKKIKEIERLLGRRKSRRWGPRRIDLDILFYGERFIDSKGLKVPHPGVFRRAFVMRPLMDVL